MRTKTWGWTLPIAAAAFLAGGLVLQRQTHATWHERLEVTCEQGRVLEMARAQNRRLVAAAVPAMELAALRADHDALIRLRAELGQLRAATQAHSAPVPNANFGTAEIPRDPGEWSNVGGPTPASALQTALWAMAGGDLNVFAGQITFEPEARPAVDTLFMQLPESVRAQHGTVERWLAAESAQNGPLTSARIVKQTVMGRDDVDLAVELYGAEFPSGSSRIRSAALSLHRGATGWNFVVPLDVVRVYAGQVRGLTK